MRAGDVAALCWAYKVDAETVDRLTAFSYKTLEQTIYEKCQDVMPSWFGMYVELESFASVISNYESDLVPGLLQTPDYARAVFRSRRPSLAEDVVEQRVATRVERAKNVLGGDAPPRINAVLSEAVIVREVGGQSVMREQVAQLRRMSRGDRVSVRVLTWNAGAHAGMEGAFTLLEFDDENEPDIAYQENRAGAAYIEPPQEVAEYRQMFAAMSQQAIPIEEYT